MDDETPQPAARAGADAKTTGLLVYLSPALRQRIDDYRFAERFPARTEAIRFLLEWALNVADSGTDAMNHFQPRRG